MDRFPLIEVNGTNYEMGFQHGEQCAETINRFVGGMFSEVNKHLGWSKEQTLNKALIYDGFVEEFSPHLHEEMKGIADGSGLSFEEILLLQVRGEFTQPVTGGQECTSYAVMSAASGGGEVLVGQNQDLQEGFQEQGIMLHMTPEKGPKMLCCTLAGSLGHNGINSSGMGWAVNALDCGGWRPGVPRYVLFRRMLEQESLDDAIEELRRAKRASSCNYMLAHASGAIADVETLVEGDGVLHPENGFLAHANNYLCQELVKHDRLIAQLPDSAIRAERMRELLNEHRESLSVETMMKLLQDHHNYPQSICRHQLSDPDAEFASMKTISSMVSRPAAGVMHVAVGNPCQNEYHAYKL